MGIFDGDIFDFNRDGKVDLTEEVMAYELYFKNDSDEKNNSDDDPEIEDIGDEDDTDADDFKDEDTEFDNDDFNDDDFDSDSF